MSLLKSIKAFMGGEQPLYIRIRSQRITVTRSGNPKTLELDPIVAIRQPDKTILAIGAEARALAQTQNKVELLNGFNHPRSIIGDFVVAEKTLQYVIASYFSEEWLIPSPKVILHPLEKTDGGLTFVERRALKEMAEGAGARSVFIAEGVELRPEELEQFTEQE